MFDEKILNIYTDGSAYHKPKAARVGGIGIIFAYLDFSQDKEIITPIECYGYKGANSAEMELCACVKALEEGLKFCELNKFHTMILHTDSMYIRNNYGNAIFQWPKRGWTKQTGEPVSNVSLWKNFIKIYKKISENKIHTEIKWERGKSTIHGKTVDKLAKQSAQTPINKPLNLVHVRRKLSPKSVERGSVVGTGKRICIRIITSQYLREQKKYKYRYKFEVVSAKSKYHKNIDIAFSKELLREGHSYQVSFKKREKGLFISKVQMEIPKAKKEAEDVCQVAARREAS